MVIEIIVRIEDEPTYDPDGEVTDENQPWKGTVNDAEWVKSKEQAIKDALENNGIETSAIYHR